MFANPTTGQVAVVNANVCCGVGGANLYLITLAFPDDPDWAPIAALIVGG